MSQIDTFWADLEKISALMADVRAFLLRQNPDMEISVSRVSFEYDGVEQTPFGVTKEKRVLGGCSYFGYC